MPLLTLRPIRGPASTPAAVSKFLTYCSPTILDAESGVEVPVNESWITFTYKGRGPFTRATQSVARNRLGLASKASPPQSPEQRSHPGAAQARVGIRGPCRLPYPRR